MNRNLKFFYDKEGTPRARGPHAEQVLMTFLETDVQGSDHVCHDIMDDLTAIEDGSAEMREFEGNAHTVTIDAEGVVVRLRDAVSPDSDSGNMTEDTGVPPATATASAVESRPAVGGPGRGEDATYRTGLKHFRQILEDWEAFILDDLDDPDESADV